MVQKTERKWCSVCIEGHHRLGLPQKSLVTCSGLIPPRYSSASLEDLPEALVAKYAALPDDMGLMLWGPAGTGKTHSMCAFARDLWNIGWDIRRTTYEMLMLEIRDTYKPGSIKTEYDIIHPYIICGKLVIEDVGTTVSVGKQETDFSLRTFLVLLDQRLEGCRATYITSNKSVEEIRKSFDARIASRLQQACEVVQLAGKDRRQHAV